MNNRYHPNKIKILISIFTFCSVTNLVYAQHTNPSQTNINENNFFYTNATITKVEPIVRTVQVSTPKRECWEQEISRPVYTEHNNASGNILIGGIIGGAIGNQFGHGDGKSAATVVGSIIGATVGNNIAEKERHTTREQVTDVERHCRVSHTTHTEDRIEGYTVNYSYRGEKFSTRMNHKPGKHLKILVQVTPVSE